MKNIKNYLLFASVFFACLSVQAFHDDTTGEIKVSLNNASSNNTAYYSYDKSYMGKPVPIGLTYTEFTETSKLTGGSSKTDYKFTVNAFSGDPICTFTFTAKVNNQVYTSGSSIHDVKNSYPKFSNATTDVCSPTWKLISSNQAELNILVYSKKV